MKPSQVPSTVAAYQDYLRTTRYHNYVQQFMERTRDQRAWAGDDVPVEMTPELGRVWCEQMADRLDISALFHVTESMTQVAIAAAHSIPDDATWSLISLPCPNGILLLEEPIHLADVWGKRAAVTGFTWNHFPFGYSEEDSAPTTLFTWFAGLPDGSPVTPELAASMRSLGPLPVNGISLMKTTQKVTPLFSTKNSPYLNRLEEYKERFREFAEVEAEELDADANDLPPGTSMLTVLWTVFRLMEQTISSSEEYTDRRAARMLAKGRRRPPPMVTIIRLRRPTDHGRYHEETGRFLRYRSLTRGHWRMQPHGPGRSQVHRIWIHPYVRGPESAPFLQPKRVTTLQR